MKHKLLQFILVIALVLATAVPALAAPNPNKDLCKGSDYIYTVITPNGRELSETVALSWEVLYSSRSALDLFPNQGQCVSHVNGGETLYFFPCAHLKGEAMREAALCNTMAWLGSPAGQ